MRADLQMTNRRFAGGKDNAGIENSEWIERLLHLLKHRHDPVAVDTGEESRPEPPIAMLARRSSAEPDDGFGDLLEKPRHLGLPTVIRDAGQEIDMDVTIAGVAEDHDRNSMSRGASRTART